MKIQTFILLTSIIFLHSIEASDIKKPETSYDLMLQGPIDDNSIVNIVARQKLSRSRDILQMSGDDIIPKALDLSCLKTQAFSGHVRTKSDLELDDALTAFLAQLETPSNSNNQQFPIQKPHTSHDFL